MQNANVTNNPHLIINCDETGLLFEFKPSKVLGRKGIRSVYSVTSGKKGQVPLLVCTNVAGVVLPPTHVFKGKKENKTITASAPAQWNNMFTEKGWMTATTFTKCLVKVGTRILLNCLFNTFACKYISMTLLQVLLHLFFVLGVHTVCGQAVLAWPKGHPLIRWAFKP